MSRVDTVRVLRAVSPTAIRRAIRAVGFTCSGFIEFSFIQAAATVPHTASRNLPE
jgi:hypothetical protein